MADWWNPFSYDYGGMADAIQHNPVAEALNYGYNSTGVGMAVNALAGRGGQRNVFGDIGHNFLGGKEQQAAEAEQANIDQAVNQYAAQANPYSPDNAGLRALMATQRDTINRQFDQQQGALRDSLAARGMIGSGQEAGGLAGLAASRAHAMSGALNGLTAQNYDMAQAWDGDRRSTLMGLLRDRRDRLQAQADAPKLLLGQLAGTGAKAGMAYATGGKAGF